MAVATEKLEKALQDDISMLTVGSDALDEIRMDLVEKFFNENYSVIYVTVDRPYKVIQDRISEAGIDGEIFFIDCMSRESGDAVRSENSVFLKPEDLSSISIAISEAVESLPGDSKKAVVIDTLNTLGMYNDEKNLSQFGHFVINKIRNWDAKSVILATEDGSSGNLLDQVSRACDCRAEL